LTNLIRNSTWVKNNQSKNRVSYPVFL